MKNLIILLFVLFTSLSFAQTEGKSDKIETMKIAFLTNKLNLTAKEAQLFWPLYNEYNQKMEVLRKSKKSESDEIKSKTGTPTDKEIAAYMEEVFLNKQKELDLQKEYYLKYIKILPMKKVALLYQAESQFKKELLQLIKKNAK
jgi:hypothetical protein